MVTWKINFNSLLFWWCPFCNYNLQVRGHQHMDAAAVDDMACKRIVSQTRKSPQMPSSLPETVFFQNIIGNHSLKCSRLRVAQGFSFTRKGPPIVHPKPHAQKDTRQFPQSSNEELLCGTPWLDIGAGRDFYRGFCSFTYKERELLFF